METFEVRDRRDGFLWISNSFFDNFISVLDPSSWLVYLALARRSNNETQSCFPSYEEISRTTGLARSTVAECLHRLKEVGAIEWDKKGRHNVYFLLVVNSPINGLVRKTTTTSPICTSNQSGPPDPNKTHNKTKEQDSLSSPPVPTGEFELSDQNPPSRKKKQSTADPRHHRFMELIFKAHEHYVQVPPTMGGACGKNLSRLLRASNGLDEKRFKRMLMHYHESEDHARAEQPAYYIPKLPKYELGPLNKFGREMETMGVGS